MKVDMNNVNSPIASASLGCLGNRCTPGCKYEAKTDTKDWSEQSYSKQAFGTIGWEDGVTT